MALEEMAALRREIDNPLRTRVLTVAGLGRSGSTLVEAALGATGQAVVLGEVIHIWERSVLGDELCGCGAAFSACAFWRSVGERAFGGWDRVDAQRLADLRADLDRVANVPRMGTALGSADFRYALEDYVWHFEQIYAAAADVSGVDLVVDSSKQPSLVHALLTSPRLDVRVLHTVRDPRAVAHAWTKVVRRPEAREEQNALMTRYRPTLTARTWMVHNAAVEALRAKGAAVELLRYEDFVADAASLTARILAFAGSAPPPGPLRGVTATTIETIAQHSCSGNPMRLTRGPITIKADEDWRAALPPRDGRTVSAITAPLLRRYLYPLRWR